MLSAKYTRYLITSTGRKMLDRISEPYMAASVYVPSESLVFSELCRLAVPWKAVKCTIKATPMTTTFLVMRTCSYLPTPCRNVSRSMLLLMMAATAAVVD